MVRILRSDAKDTPAAAAKDRRHLARERLIGNEDAVRLREERMQQDAVKAQRAKNREIRQQAATAAAKPVASSAKHTQRKATGSKEVPLSLLSDGEETEGEVLGDESDSGGEPYRTRIVQSALFCAIGHFVQMNSAKTVCATLVYTIQLHDALLQTGCTIIPDAQIYGKHNQIGYTNLREAQSGRIHKSTGSTIR